MIENVGIVVFSFALGENEPNPCNLRLIQELRRIVDEEARIYTNISVVVVQWEIAEGPDRYGSAELVVKQHRQKGAYLDSEEVMRQAAELFRQEGITKVIAVAQPFLHLAKCRKLVREAGFTCLKRKIRPIGFYPESKQWWTRSWWQLLAYAVMQKLFGRKGR